MTNLSLTLGDAALDDGDLQALTVELRKSIASHTDADAALVTGAALPGSKGDAVTIGTLALALITSGSVSALIAVLQTFVARRPSLHFEVSGANGQVLKLDADSLRGTQVSQTISVLQGFVSKA